MKKIFVVATNADYTILCLAEDKEQAVKKSNLYYMQKYGEERDDWEAYEAVSYVEDNEIMPIRAWVD